MPRHQPQLTQFAEAFAQRGTVAQVAAGHDQMVGHVPVKRLGNLKGGRLLPFQPVRIHRVQQIDRRFLHDLRQQFEAAVEVGGQLAGDGAVIHGLRELAPGDLALGNQHQALQPGARGVGGHRGRGVAGRSAGHASEAALLGHAHRRGHARVFERAGGIHALMLGVKLVDAQGFGGARQVIERRVALEQGHGVAKVLQNGQQLAEAPDAGVVQRLGGGAPLPPEPFECGGVGPVMAPALFPAGVFHFKQLSADRATEVRPGLRACNPRPTSNTTQLVQMIVHA